MMATDIQCPRTNATCDRNCWRRCAPAEDAPVFELCERCGSEGRIYEYIAPNPSSGRFDPDERDLGECSACNGEGLICMPGIPRTKWDDCEMFDYFDGALDALCAQSNDTDNARGATMAERCVRCNEMFGFDETSIVIDDRPHHVSCAEAFVEEGYDEHLAAGGEIDLEYEALLAGSIEDVQEKE